MTKPFIVDHAKVVQLQEELNKLALTVEGPLFAAVLMNHVADTYSVLHKLGYETPDSLKKLFDYALGVALAPPEGSPQIIQEGPSSTTKQ
jgi:hypothetical protein